MNKHIDIPTVGEILSEEFMIPMNISAYKLANDIHVPVSRIQDILHNRRRITADTSIRLAKYFGVSDNYFLNIQNDIDIRQIKQTMAPEEDTTKDMVKTLVCPEFTLPPEAIVKIQGSSRGTQPKYYADKVWFKANSLGYEDDAECLASIVLRYSNVDDYVIYEKCMINNRRGCISRDFLLKDEAFISFAKLYSSITNRELSEVLVTLDGPAERVEYVRDFIKENYNLDVSDYLSKILALDMLIINVDRHLNNLGIIVRGDGRTRLAPIFDNGGALLSDMDRFCNSDFKEDVSRATGYPFTANLENQASSAGIGLRLDYDRLLEALEKYQECKAKEVLIYQLDRYKNLLNARP